MHLSPLWLQPQSAGTESVGVSKSYLVSLETLIKNAARLKQLSPPDFKLTKEDRNRLRVA